MTPKEKAAYDEGRALWARFEDEEALKPAEPRALSLAPCSAWGGKPKEPGRYRTRWKGEPDNARLHHTVTVRRSGRGLQVIPDPPYNRCYPMSSIGEEELDWCALPNDRNQPRDE